MGKKWPKPTPIEMVANEGLLNYVGPDIGGLFSKRCSADQLSQIPSEGKKLLICRIRNGYPFCKMGLVYY